MNRHAVKLALLIWGMAGVAHAHDAHLALSLEEQRVFDFYAGWKQPKGGMIGKPHRGRSCCNKVDCFPVVEIKKDSGVYRIRVRDGFGRISGLYRVDPAVLESNQEDPRESPDGRSHACIEGGMVVCMVEGTDG